MEELLERVVLDDVQKMARHYSLLHCPHCGVGLQHRWKDGMNRSGVWAAEGQVVHADGTVTGERPEAHRQLLAGWCCSRLPVLGIADRALLPGTADVRHYR